MNIPALRLLPLLLLFATCALAAPPTVEVRIHNGRPIAHIDGVPDPLVGYNPRAWTPEIFTPQIERFFRHKMGVYLLTVPYRANHDFFGTQFWDGDSLFTEPTGTIPPPYYDNLDVPAAKILQGDPDTRILVRFGIHEPRSWQALHRDQLVVNDEGRTLQVASLASDLYWNAAAQYCTNVIRYYEGRPWADRIIGYANFHRMEGTHEAAIEGWLYDHSPVMTARWRAYLKAKYGTEERLRAAHRNRALTFETAEVPTDKLYGTTREVARLHYWQAARDNQPLRDYLELQRDLFHARYRQISTAMQAGSDRKVLLLHDALKQTMLGWDINDFFNWNASKSFAMPEVMAGSGSMGVASLFDIPGHDGLITPHDYQARGVGGIFEPEGIADSCVLRGKLYYCEMDTRTYSADYRMNDYGTARDLREFSAVTWRNVGTALTRGFWFYWMDLAHDWFADEAMHPVIARQTQVLKESVNWRHETMPGIAVILDDSAVLETNGNATYVTEAIQWEQKTGLSRCGVPYRIYLLEDLALPNFPQHRVYYFPNLFKVDDARLALLREKVFRDGNVVVWGPGSGISDGRTIGTASAQRLTGFQFELWPVNFSHRALVSNFDHPITRGLRADTTFGSPLSYGPLLFPKDGTPLALAWTKQGVNFAGLAVKEFGKGARGAYRGKDPLGAGDYAAVFTHAVPLPGDLWRNLARYAGAHIYSDSGDIIMADSSLVGLHSLQSGPKTLLLPGRYRVTDVISGKLYSRRTDIIRFTLQAPETRLFRLEPAR